VLSAPEALDLVAVTTVGRGGRIRARVAAALLALAGRRGVDVCVGEQRPLLRGADRFNWFDHEERCIAAAAAPEPSEEPAPERIVRAAREHAGLELLLIGPLTNLARALALDPELPRRVAAVTIMGGHVREARIGRLLCRPGIDYNLCSDPEASVAVMGAGFDATLVTADVTLTTWLRDADVERLAGGGPLARELARQVQIWKPVQHRIFSGLGGTLDPDNAAYLHDPLTALALLDASVLRLEPLRIVTTIVDGGLRTLEVDPRALAAPLVRVATAVQPRPAAAAIVERLVRL
jgi:purine nucleosidase